MSRNSQSNSFLRNTAFLASMAALTGCLFAGAARAADVTLRIEHLMAPIAPLQKKVLEPWCRQLADDSRGRIACEIYPAMQLGGTPAQLADLTKNGVIDIAWTVPGYTAGRFPVLEAMELPFVVKDAVSGSRAAWEFYRAHAQKELDAYKVLAISMDGGMALHTSSKKIASPDDIKGLKLRASGRMMAKTLSALGANTVAMPTPQITDAVSKGVIDGLLGAWELIIPFKLDEVTKYHVDPPAGAPFPASAVVMLIMNKEKYNSMPDDLKAVLDRNSGEFLVNMFGKVWEEATFEGRAKVKASGGEIVSFSARDMETMKAATKSVEDEWIREMTEKGHDGKALAAAARAFGAK